MLLVWQIIHLASHLVAGSGREPGQASSVTAGKGPAVVSAPLPEQQHGREWGPSWQETLPFRNGSVRPCGPVTALTAPKHPRGLNARCQPLCL